MRKLREKIRKDEGLYEASKKKDRERKATEYRKKKASMSTKERASYKLKRAQIQRQWRAKNKKGKVAEKVDGHESNTGKNLTPQSLGKAVRKVKKQLPKSPSKASCVIAKVVEGMSPRKRRSVLEICDSLVKRRKLESDTRKKRSDALSKESIQEIQQFYHRDDISRMCPGRKECVSVRTPTGKEVRQKRLLLYNLSEVYEMFKADSKIEVGFSKFVSLRPPEVMPITLRDQSVCMCKYHENIQLMINGINPILPSLPKTAEELLGVTVCDTNNVKCADRECKKCGVEGPIDEVFDEVDDDLSVSYYQWKTTNDGKVVKEQINSTIGEAKDDLIAQLEPFARHIYNSRRQFNELSHLKDTLAPGEIIVQEDFAENFQLKHQREIMSAHWHNEMVTVFTAVVYYRDGDGTLQHQSYAVVSDEMSHDKSLVYACNSAILKEVKKITEVKKVHYWTDGPSSQFKNRYNLSTVICHEGDFGCGATWNFFETAHGKGPCDGVGAEVKRTVWRAILQSNVVVTSPSEFFLAAQNLCKKVKVLFCSGEQVKEVSEQLAERWSRCKPIPATHSIHYVAATHNDDSVKVAKNSQFLQTDQCKDHILLQALPSVPSPVIPTACSASSKPMTEENLPPPVNPKTAPKEKGNHPSVSTVSSNASVNVNFGLPPILNAKFSNPGHIDVAPYNAQLVAEIINEQIRFNGKGIISTDDLSSLKGGHSKPEDNFLNNFIVDSYLQLLQAANPGIAVISWEHFEKSSLSQQQVKGILDHDLIIVPCNPVTCKHWFLLVVCTKKKQICVLDSLAGAFVKPTAKTAVLSMWKILQTADNHLQLKDWDFAANKPTDVPQQTNAVDCGAFICLYARCLATNTPMISSQVNISAFRQHMILELHYQALLPPTFHTIQKDAYYGVDYVNNYYIGRVLELPGALIQLKFLHKIGAQRFGWPIRDDVDTIHPSQVFYGPIQLHGNCPFEVCNLKEIEMVFKLHRKKSAF